MGLVLLPLLTPLIGAAAAGVASNVFTLGLTLGASLLSQRLGARKASSHSSGQVTAKVSSTARVRAYGRVKIGGTIFFLAASTELCQGMVHCQGPIDQIEEWWLNDQACSTTPGSEAYQPANCWPWYQQVALQSQHGRKDQSVNPMIQYMFSDWWTSDHRLRGLVVTAMQCITPGNPKETFSRNFPNGAPALRIVARAALLYDPRIPSQDWEDEETWTWSENAALVLLDFLVHPDGMNISRARIDLASFVDFANLCDEWVTSTGQPWPERRYRCWGTYSLDEEPRDVLPRILASCDGDLTMLAEGTVGVRGGRYDAPTVIISDEMILSYEAEQGPDRVDAYTQLRIRYTEPTQDYQLLEGDPYTGDDSGEIVAASLDLPMVPSYLQALRLAKIKHARDNPDWSITVNCTLAALNAIGEPTVRLVLADLEIDATFSIKSLNIAGDLSSVTLGLAQIDEEPFTWSGTTAQGPSTPATGDTSVTIPAVSGLAVSLVTTTSGAGYIYSVAASVDAPANAALALSAEVSADGGATWAPMYATGDWSASSYALAAGASYMVRVAFRTPGGRLGAYSYGTTSTAALGVVGAALAAGTAVDLGDLSAATASDDFGGFGAAVAVNLGSAP